MDFWITFNWIYAVSRVWTKWSYSNENDVETFWHVNKSTDEGGDRGGDALKSRQLTHTRTGTEWNIANYFKVQCWNVLLINTCIWAFSQSACVCIYSKVFFLLSITYFYSLFHLFFLSFEKLSVSWVTNWKEFEWLLKWTPSLLIHKIS